MPGILQEVSKGHLLRVGVPRLFQSPIPQRLLVQARKGDRHPSGNGHLLRQSDMLQGQEHTMSKKGVLRGNGAMLLPTSYMQLLTGYAIWDLQRPPSCASSGANSGASSGDMQGQVGTMSSCYGAMFEVGAMLLPASKMQLLEGSATWDLQRPLIQVQVVQSGPASHS